MHNLSFYPPLNKHLRNGSFCENNFCTPNKSYFVFTFLFLSLKIKLIGISTTPGFPKGDGLYLERAPAAYAFTTHQ
jgi:hypothetical protein